MIKVLIVDDHILFADSLSLILDQDDEIEVIKTACNGEEALILCSEHMPDIVLLDIKMPRMDGIKAAQIIRNRFASIKIVMLTTFDDDVNIVESFLNEANGYIIKDVRPEQFIAAIKCVYQGFYVMHKNVQKCFLKRILRNIPKEVSCINFNPQDIEIIRCMSNGKSNREISSIMNYSEGTIKNRISAMLKKAGLKDRTQLVVYALKNDMI